MGGPKGIRRRHSGSFKAEVALEALKERGTINEVASKFKIHPAQVSGWKKTLQEGAPNLFNSGTNAGQGETTQAHVDNLFEEIGRLKFELDWLKKKTARFT